MSWTVQTFYYQPFGWKAPVKQETFKNTRSPEDLFIFPEDLNINPEDVQEGTSWTVEDPPEE